MSTADSLKEQIKAIVDSVQQEKDLRLLYITVNNIANK